MVTVMRPQEGEIRMNGEIEGKVNLERKTTTTTTTKWKEEAARCGGTHTSVISALGRQRQDDPEFKVSF